MPASTQAQAVVEVETPFVDPATQPKLVLKRGPTVESDLPCPYEVVPQHFPAMDVDRTVIVHAAAHVDGPGDETDEYMLLSWLAPEQAQREDLVYDHYNELSAPCSQVLAEVKRNVDAFNAELARYSWVPLEALDVIGVDSDAGLGRLEGDPSRIETLPLERRPVEILYRGTQFIARVRQAEVLMRIERPHWWRDDETCKHTPNMRSLHVDRRTGLALVSFDYINGGCLCDDHVFVEAIWVPLELIAEVERRPTSVLDELKHHQYIQQYR